MGLYADQRSLSTLGGGWSSLNDAALLNTFQDADQFSQLQRAQYEAVASGNMNQAHAIHSQLQEYGNQFGNQNNRNPYTEYLAQSMGYRRDPSQGFNWLDRTLND